MRLRTIGYRNRPARGRAAFAVLRAEPSPRIVSGRERSPENFTANFGLCPCLVGKCPPAIFMETVIYTLRISKTSAWGPNWVPTCPFLGGQNRAKRSEINGELKS